MIRPATPADVPAILELGKAMHAESGYRSLCFDADKVAALANNLIATPSAGCILIAEQGGSLKGFMAGVVTEAWFSKDRIAADLGLFVEPTRRGGMLGAMLVVAFVDWARAQGVAETHLGITTGVKIEETERLYLRLGFEKVGGLYKRGSHV